MNLLILSTLLLFFHQANSQSPPPNDECINAIVVDPFSGEVLIGDTSHASIETMGLDFCGGQIDGPGVWYKTTNPLPFAIKILATTCNEGTDFDTKIGVFTGDSCGNLQCIGGSDNGILDICFFGKSQYQFIADPLTTYHILVHGGYSGAVGNYHLSIVGKLPNANYFALIDSKTDQVIEEIDSTIDYSFIESTSSALNIEAVFTNRTSIESVRITFDNPTISKCENTAPYSVFGNIKTDFRSAIIPVGSHTVSAATYSRKGCKGLAGTTISKSFEVKPCFLIVTTGMPEFGENPYYLPDGYVFGSFCNLNLGLDLSCGFIIKKVNFVLRNTTSIVHTKVERVAPYFLFGNEGYDVLNEGTIEPGEYTLELTVDGIQHPSFHFAVSNSCN